MEGLPGTSVSQINFDDEGKVWFCSNGGGVGVYDGKGFSSVSVEQGLLSRNAIALKYMPCNGLFYAGAHSGLSVNKDIKSHPLAIKELETTAVRSISEFRKNL